MNIKWIGAHPNNFATGRSGNSVQLIVLHWIAGSLESADATFNDPNRQASAHYGIGGQEVHQYVKEEDTAWHCGDLTKNKQSIGIEHEGGPNLPVSEATVQTSIQLVAEICRRYNIPADSDHIKRHSSIKATQCPGTLPVERVIEEASKLLMPAEPPVVDPMKVKVDLLEPFGVLEVQAIRSQLADKDRDIASQKELIEGLQVQMTGANTLVDTYKQQQQHLAETLNCENNYPAILAEIKKLIHQEDQRNEADTSWVPGLIAFLKSIFKKRGDSNG